MSISFLRSWPARVPLAISRSILVTSLPRGSGHVSSLFQDLRNGQITARSNSSNPIQQPTARNVNNHGETVCVHDSVNPFRSFICPDPYQSRSIIYRFHFSAFSDFCVQILVNERPQLPGYAFVPFENKFMLRQCRRLMRASNDSGTVFVQHVRPLYLPKIFSRAAFAYYPIPNTQAITPRRHHNRPRRSGQSWVSMYPAKL